MVNLPLWTQGSWVIYNVSYKKLPMDHSNMYRPYLSWLLRATQTNQFLRLHQGYHEHNPWLPEYSIATKNPLQADTKKYTFLPSITIFSNIST